MSEDVKEVGPLFCMQRLEKKILDLNGTEPTTKQAFEIMVAGFSCFIEFAKEVNRRITAIDRRSRARTSPKWWFIDRVLPAIIIAIILGVMNWFALVNTHVMSP